MTCSNRCAVPLAWRSQRGFRFYELVFGALAFAVGCGTTGQQAEPAAGPAAAQASAKHHGEAAHGRHHHGRGPLVHRFKRAEDWAQQFDDPARDAWQKPEEVVAGLSLAPGMVVADIGAGTGYFEPYLSAAVGEEGQVLALDLEPDMVRYLRERASQEGLSNVVARQVEMADPGLPPAGVDRILIVDTWHHIPDRIRYAEKLRAGLAPAGRVYIVDFTAEASHGPPVEHRVGPEAVQAELQAAGFTTELLEETLQEQYIVVGYIP